MEPEDELDIAPPDDQDVEVSGEGGEGGFTPEPGAPPEGYVSRDDFDRLNGELEQHRLRDRHLQGMHDEQQERYRTEQTVRSVLERMFYEHQHHQARQTDFQPPEPENLEELLVEPARLLEYINRHGSWLQKSIMAQVGPHLQRLSMYDAVLPVVLGREAEASMERAKKLLEDEGVTDFDAMRPEIEAAFSQNPNGPRLLLDPHMVTSVYHFISRQRGGVRPVREASKPVPFAGRTGAGTKTAAPAISPAVRAMANRLQLDPAKLAKRMAQRR